MTRRTPRGAAAVLAIALAAGSAARAQTFKSAHWISTVEIDSGARAGGGMPGDYEIWWKEGKTRMNVVIRGIAVHMLKIGDELYTWAEGQTTGMKVGWSASQGGKRPNSEYVNRIEEFRAKGKKVGAETIEGHPCEVWEYRDPSGTQGKYWLAQDLKNFPVKAEMDIGAGKMTYRNRDIETPGSVPEPIFAPPENLGFQDISQGMNRGGRTPTVKPTAFPVGPLPRWTPTRTPTKVLGALEVTPTAPEVTPWRETPVPGKGLPGPCRRVAWSRPAMSARHVLHSARRDRDAQPP